MKTLTPKFCILPYKEKEQKYRSARFKRLGNNEAKLAAFQATLNRGIK